MYIKYTLIASFFLDFRFTHDVVVYTSKFFLYIILNKIISLKIVYIKV